MADRHDAWQRLADAGLSDARNAYQDALPIYRQINDRLGEANCQQGLGLLAMAENDAHDAFRRFAELPAIYEAIQDHLGLQAALGYMARAAHAMEHPDRALLLAGESLQVGRDIDDRFGQTINLELMLRLFRMAGNEPGFLGALVLSRALLAEIQDQARLAPVREIWEQVRKQLSPPELEQLEAEAPALLDRALAAARGRFGDGDPRRLD